MKLSTFLKENNAYELFLKNFNKIFFKNSCDINIEISNSHKWEDINYWAALSIKWDYIVNDLKEYDMNWLLDEKCKNEFKNNFKDYDLLSEFDGEILKEVGEYYIGWADVPGYGLSACKWTKDGSTNYECYKLTPITKEWYEVDTHWILTKENNTVFRPRRKFKIAWTKDMKDSLIATGWRFATPEEIKYLKLEN